MGMAKPTLPYESSTMIGAVVEAAEAAGLAPIFVVTGFHSQEVTEAVGGTARIARNPEPELGNMSSLLIGLDAVGDAEGIVLLLADMPGVESQVIVDLVDGVGNTGSRCGWVEYDEGRGHPIALSRPVFDDVRTLTGTKALWPFFSSLPEGDVFVLRVTASRPIDVNTQADYERAKQLIDGSGPPRAFHRSD